MTHDRDTLLNGRVRLRQPENGFRAAIDSVFLAAALTPKPDTRVLEAGCGHGAALLCLAHRCSGVKIDGLEVDGNTAEMARENVRRNGREERCRRAFFLAGQKAGFLELRGFPPGARKAKTSD